MKRAVFFDRDGVLNETAVRDGTPHPPQSVAELKLVPGAADAVRRVRNAGFYAIVITNQPDVARGTATQQQVDEINAAVAHRLAIDATYACYHDDADGCDCRKPKTGLLVRAARDYGIDLRQSFLIGDRAKDAQCGRAAGCTTVFIDFKYAETPAGVDADAIVTSLGAAVDAVLKYRAAIR